MILIILLILLNVMGDWVKIELIRVEHTRYLMSDKRRQINHAMRMEYHLRNKMMYYINHPTCLTEPDHDGLCHTPSLNDETVNIEDLGIDECGLVKGFENGEVAHYYRITLSSKDIQQIYMGSLLIDEKSSVKCLRQYHWVEKGVQSVLRYR